MGGPPGSDIARIGEVATSAVWALLVELAAWINLAVRRFATFTTKCLKRTELVQLSSAPTCNLFDPYPISTAMAY